MSDYEIFVLAADGSIVGQIPYERLRLTLRYNAPGRGQVILATNSLPETITPDGFFDQLHRVSIRRGGRTLMSGIITEISRSWNSEHDMLTIGIDDDLSLLAGRIIIPVPAGPPYNAASHHVLTGYAEDIIHLYLAYHAGDMAKIERRLPGLTQAPSLQRGPILTARARFTPLLATLQRLAAIGGLGIRMIDMHFEVYEPGDSGTIFSDIDQTLISFERTVRCPGATYCYVGGSGQGEYRIIVERARALERWGRIEMFYDQRNLADTTELQIAGDVRLSEAAREADIIRWEANASLDSVNLGQFVTIEALGRVYSDIVRQIDVQTDGVSETVRVASGRVDALNIYKRIDNLEEAVSLLEVM